MNRFLAPRMHANRHFLVSVSATLSKLEIASPALGKQFPLFKFTVKINVNKMGTDEVQDLSKSPRKSHRRFGHSVDFPLAIKELLGFLNPRMSAM